MDDELTRELAVLRQVWPGVGIVVLTDATVPGRPAVIERFNAALQRGYALLPKERLRSVDDLVHTLLNTCEGRVVLDAAVTETLMRARPSEQLIMDRFSARETDVLHLMSAGYCNKAIAMDLCISCKTVERHIQSIYSKVGDPLDEIQPRAHAVAVYHGAMAA
jgi:DNA-binding NarL/FixJ family response regulator